MKLAVRDLEKSYASRQGSTRALLPTSFEIGSGEFVSLLGPSGCGKSTTLQLIAGLDSPSGGQILLDGEPVTGPGHERGMVFQSYTLYPWLTVAENAAFSFGLCDTRAARRRHGQGDPDFRARVDSLLGLMGLDQFRKAYPRELSGGMKQRVAIVRALASRPKVLLMDEPFGALDAQTRESMQQLMLALHAHEKTTVLFVTHDVEEAIYLSTRILVFSARPGRILDDAPVPFGPGATRTFDLKLDTAFMEEKRRLLGLLHAQEHHPRLEREALLASLVREPPQQPHR